MMRFIISLALLLELSVTPVFADELLLRENAPERYVVVKGDTLWDISGKFLTSPWRWPEIWQLNKQQIKDPHWIYPGDVVVLDKSGATPRLVLERDGKLVSDSTVRVGPQIRVDGVEGSAIPSIPASAIAPFLSKPLIIDENRLASAPNIVATEDSRVIIGAGDRAYVEGVANAGARNFLVYRPGKVLRDPDTDLVLAHEAFYLGEATLKKFGDPSTIEILRSKIEINRGDRLLQVEEDQIINYVPRAPDRAVKGRVLSSYSGVNEVAQNSIITINLGRQDGIEVGHVLAAYRRGAEVDSEVAKKKRVKLPDERVGLVFVFRVFDKIAYALIVQSTRQLQLGDVVQTPPA
jgi:hypothetical protein